MIIFYFLVILVALGVIAWIFLADRFSTPASKTTGIEKLSPAEASKSLDWKSRLEINPISEKTEPIFPIKESPLQTPASGTNISKGFLVTSNKGTTDPDFQESIKILELKKAIGELEEKIRQRDEQIKTYERQSTELALEKEQREQTKKQLESQRQDIRKEQDALQLNLEKERSEFNKLKTTLTAENEQWKQKNQQLTLDLQGKESEKNIYRKKYEETEKKASELEIELKKRETHIDELIYRLKTFATSEEPQNSGTARLSQIEKEPSLDAAKEQNSPPPSHSDLKKEHPKQPDTALREAIDDNPTKNLLALVENTVITNALNSSNPPAKNNLSAQPDTPPKKEPLPPPAIPDIPQSEKNEESEKEKTHEPE